MSLRRDDALTEHMPQSAAWRGAPEHAVRVHGWDADTVVYVHDSAATHWLERDAAAVFLALRSSAQSLTVQELAAAIDPGAGHTADLEALLLQLRSLGLASIDPSAPR